MESSNRINAYTCEKLHSTVTWNKDAGVTPMFITCDQCGGMASSRMYRVDQSLIATKEWYKPTEEDITNEANEVAEKNGIGYKIVYATLKEHVAKGGLLLRDIKKLNDLGPRNPPKIKNQDGSDHVQYG